MAGVVSGEGGSQVIDGAPPTFVGRGLDVTYVGQLTSNQFLHGTLVMRLELPSTPGGPITGYAALRDRNVAATGSLIRTPPSGT